MNELKRNCPECNEIIEYKTKYSCKAAGKNNSRCSSCYRKEKGRGKKEKKYVRNCPSCSKDIWYTYEATYIHGKKHKINCKSCSSRISQNKPEQKQLLSSKLKGKKGTNVYDVWVRSYGEEIAREMWDKRYAEHSDKMKGENNPMFGKNVYDVWTETYGKEKADNLQNQMIEKCRIASLGENNPMYGKPAPQGSGNGWKGWYKDIYFASLGELFYLKYLLDNNIKFENGEKKKYKVEYEFMNKKLNYFLDFYLPESDEYIEIKPKKLVNSPKNIAKFTAAKNKLGDKFVVLNESDIQQIDLETMYKLYLEKEIIFMKKYEEKFLDYYQDNKE